MGRLEGRIWCRGIEVESGWERTVYVLRIDRVSWDRNSVGFFGRRLNAHLVGVGKRAYLYLLPSSS